VDAERAGILATLARLPPGEVAKQREVLLFAVQREPAEPWWRLALADADLSSHEAVSARAERERDLGRVEASEELVLEAREDLDRARADAEEALRLDPGIAEGETLLGYVYSRRADLADGIEERDRWRRLAGEHYARALSLDPADLPALLNAAENAIYFDEFEEAAKLLSQAVELAPKAALAWVNLGYAYYAGGRLKEAKACYAQALRLRPEDARLRTAHADALRSLDRNEEAVRELERALEQVGGDDELRADIVFKLAAIHEYEERYREAIRAYERYIALGGPDRAKANSRIRHIYRHAFE
jgi:tetratricopeptide (TPR) repeat protein